MNKFLVSLESETYEEDDLLADFEELRDIVEQIDMSRAFARQGGLLCMLGFLQNSSLSESLRSAAANTINTMAQNNAEVQSMAVEKGVLASLLRILHTSFEVSSQVSSSDLSDALKSKVLYAISGIIRGHVAAEELFFASRGCELLSRCIQSSSTPLVSRSVFLTYALLNSTLTGTDPSLLVSAASRVSQLCGGLLSAGERLIQSTGDVNTLEFLLRFLLLLTSNAQLGRPELRRYPNLKSALVNRFSGPEVEADSIEAGIATEVLKAWN